MKPIVSTLFLALLLIAGLVTGCGKEGEDVSSSTRSCWTCTITSISRYSASPQNNSNVTSKQTVCNQTEAEIRDTEKQGTHTQTAGSGSNTVSIATTTSCIRQ